jgi:molybdenum ABC transporter molybdate-binding protein
MMRHQWHTSSIAPVMDWTARHCRFFRRLLMRRARTPCSRSAKASMLLAMALCALAGRAAASEAVSLYAAGSLREALGETARAFEATTGAHVRTKFGPSGLLKDEIGSGAAADVFTSANMGHPQALANAGISDPVVLFARNRLCALVRPGLAVTPATLADLMLDPGIKLGTSTPKADPSGDYAWEVFRKLDAVKPGSFTVLEAKALQLIGGAVAPPPASNRSPVGELVAEGKADIFLTYCTGALTAQRENPGEQIVQLPVELAVAADYGLTVMKAASAGARGFALFIMSIDGQRVLAKHGFEAPALPGK